MKKVRVPVHRTSPTQSVLIDPAATVGAQFGVNLLDPDGKLVPWPIVVPSSGGTSLTTTDDLDEGQWNLWFTNRRAQDAVGAILTDTDTIDLAYVGGTSITGTLKDLANSGVGAALVKLTRDAKGRISGTSAATTTDLTEGTNLYFTDGRADARITLQKGVANGLAPLGSDGKVNVSYLPAAVLGQVSYQGTWDASAGTPPTTTPSKGWYYIVTVAGSTNLSGITDWKVGDWAIYSGTAWDKVDNTDAIVTWNGRTGAVVPQTGDYTPAQVGAEAAIAAGTTAQYWRGDKTWQTLNKAAVGLSAVDNTSDVNKPVSTAQAAAIAAVDAAALHNTGNETASGVKSFTSGTRVSVPPDFWTGNPGVFFGSEGYFGTNGNFAMSFRSNGYRAIGTTWTSMARNGLPGASGIDMLPTGILRFGADSSAPTGFDVTWRWEMTTAAFRPFADNVYSHGDASHRPTVLWAASGTISTSDAREKTAVAPLTIDELAAAADLSHAIGTYQWLESVQLKGADARHHAGLTVQRAIEIMQAHGLDPFRYGFICYDQWDDLPEVVNSWPAQGAVFDGVGNVITPAIEAGSEVTQAYRPAGDRYSFRHDELLLFIARGFAARLDALESA